MISCSFIHGNNGGSSSPSRLAFPSAATNNEESMMSPASFDSSLEMLVAGLSGTSPSAASSPSPSPLVPPPPLSRIMVASKRYFPSVSSAVSEDTTESTCAAEEERTTPSGFHKDAAIQQQSSSSSSYHKRDSLLAALALGSSTKSYPQDASSDVRPKIDLKQDEVLKKCIKKRKGRVCFAQQATCYPPSIHAVHGADSCSITPQEQESYWYSRQDLGEMKRAAKRSCHGLNLDIALNKVYNSIIATNHHDDDDDNDNTNDSDINVMAAAQDLQQLPHFEMQRGLERWSSRFQMFSRCVTILQAKTEVMLEQVNQQYLHQKRDADQFRQAIRESSRKSARYARLLGLADAHAAGMLMASPSSSNHHPVDNKDDNNVKSTTTQ